MFTSTILGFHKVILVIQTPIVVGLWQGPLTSPHSQQTFLWQLSLQQQSYSPAFLPGS